MTPALRPEWNRVITEVWDQLDSDLGGDADARVLRRDPRTLQAPSARKLEWPSDPLQPAVCSRRPEIAVSVQRLCDGRGSNGTDFQREARPLLHREYCEYVVVYSEGRPKRVEVTTELGEYWRCIARHAPERLRQMVIDMLDTEPRWKQLYGLDDPEQRSPEERAAGFDSQLVGGAAELPDDSLNARHALFMRSGINGLDDLLGTAACGARLFAAREEDQLRSATWEEIQAALDRRDLACNHADPTILLGLHTRAFDGEDVAFENPLGIYLQPPNLDVFRYDGRPVPESWLRMSRGDQRLVFGPPDEHEAFLDDIVVAAGADESPLVGGYQLLREITVEVRLLVAPRPTASRTESQIVPANERVTGCGTRTNCADIRDFAARLEEPVP